MPAFPRNWTRALLGAVIAGAATLAQALEVKPFSAETLAAAQAAGKPVAVHFHAEWCTTCKQQEKVLAQLKTEAGLDLTLLVADYDKERDLRRALKVRSQSTMVVFRGKEEKARLGGDTDPAKFRAAFKAAL